MCGFVRPSEPLVDTLNTTCRSRYAKYNELGEDEEDTETEENVSDSSSGAVDMPAAGKHIILLLDRMDSMNNSFIPYKRRKLYANGTELHYILLIMTEGLQY